jgi:uncharacterized protein YidB (DUF937 family)
MGLLDGALGNIVGGMMGGGKSNPMEAMLGGLLGNMGGGQNAKGGMALAAIMAMVQSSGGIGGLLGKLKASGLGDQAASWVGTGANAPVSAGQLKDALGGSAITDLASKLGVNEDEAGGALATMLPEMVNQMTPNGKVEDDSDDFLSKGLEMLKGLSK